MERELYFEIEFLCAFILFLVFLLRIDRKSADRSSRLFTLLSIMVMTVLLTDGTAVLLDKVNVPAAWIATQVSSFYCDSAAHIVSGLWLVYTMMWMSDSDKTSPKTIAVLMIPALCGIVLMCFNLPLHFMYKIDAENVFHRGPLFFMLFIIPFLYIFLAFAIPLAKALKEKDTQLRRKGIFITVMMIFPLAGGIIQLISFGLPLTWPAVTISLLFIYFKLQAQKAEKEQLAIEHMKYEMVKKDVAIMLSQIQPHFLYNALSTIKGLAVNDSDKACEAIDCFAYFLRGNMDSLSVQGLIPFEQELEHTKLYLTLEQMRFGDRLKVIYLLQTVNFGLPPLTLQPIVENAVRYGITKKEGGGTITIAAMKKDKTITLTVADDGIGFNPMEKHSDGRSHLGIQNVRDRLNAQTGGELVITSAPGKGTVAVITIPVSSGNKPYQPLA